VRERHVTTSGTDIGLVRAPMAVDGTPTRRGANRAVGHRRRVTLGHWQRVQQVGQFDRPRWAARGREPAPTDEFGNRTLLVAENEVLESKITGGAKSDDEASKEKKDELKHQAG
jgi:hypothetical protein